VVEEKVDEIFLRSERDAVLPPDEAKPVAKFEEKGLQARDQTVFDLAFLHFLSDAQEFQVVAALQHFIRLLREIFGQSQREVVRLLFGDGTLVSAGLDLIKQDIPRPAEARGGAEIPEAGGWVGEFV